MALNGAVAQIEYEDFIEGAKEYAEKRLIEWANKQPLPATLTS